MAKLQESVAKIYIAYMCIAFCLFYHNNYIDIMQAKRFIYLLGSILYVLVAIVLYLIENAKKRGIPAKDMLFGAALLISWGISFGLSIDKSEAFWGYDAKCTGLLLYATGAVVVFFLWKYLVWTPTLTWLFLIGTGIVCQLQILNRWGIDPLGMYSNLIDEEKGIFISTIGQVNYNAAFDCFVIAILLVLFLLCKERFSQIIYGTVLLIAYGGAICCCSDSIYFVLAVMFYALFIYVYKHPEKWIRFCVELVLLDIAIFGIWICWSFVRPVHFWGISALLFNMKLHWGLTGAMWILILLGVLCSAKFKKMWKWYGAAVLISILPMGVGILNQSIEHWQIANELEWANSRMEIWSKVWRTFKQAPVIHKLWGYGFNNVNQALALVGENHLGSQELYDAHNIFMNSLLTSGIVGTFLGTAFLTKLFIDCAKCTKSKETALIGCAIVLAYITQGMLNGPQILTEPVYIVGIGVALGISKNRKR